jgi:hypothetical protein
VIATTGPPDTVVLATGADFPDAVAVSGYAAANGWPILLATRNWLPTATAELLAELDGVQVLPVGGPAAISDAVLDELHRTGHPIAPRLSGATRYDTSVAVALAHHDQLGGARLWVASGEDYPDALTAGVAAAADRALLALTHPDTTGWDDGQAGPYTILVDAAACAVGEIRTGRVVGGEAAVSRRVLDELIAGLHCMGPPYVVSAPDP